jgi:AraC-like DNA-binding protein
MDNVQTVMLEHNIIVTSKYFRDIKISSLSRRLKLSESETQKILQDMTSENKIVLSIDHRAGVIFFKSGNLITNFIVF